MNPELQKSLDKSPKDGNWYALGTDILCDDFDVDSHEINTFVKWNEDEQDWQFITLKDKAVHSVGMMNTSRSEDEQAT